MSSFKHLLRAKSARIVVPVFLSVFIALAAGISFSCSFLEDDGFFDKIEGEVSVANADKMNVYLRYATIKFGKTTPADAALYQVKNNVAFSVTAVTNSDYAFYRWAAFSTKDFDVAKQHMSMVYVNDDDYYANFGSLELDASVVKFENPRAETTNVTVLQTRDDIWIMPVIAVRPTIAGTFPGTSQTPVRNTKLRVQFSKPMDIESFEGNFIISQATRAADFSLKEDPITEKFKMEINEKGNLVTFSFIDTDEMFNPAVVVRLYFTDDIADSTGYTMADSKTLEWNIGTYKDTLPPLITEMTAGIGSDCSKFASTPTKKAATATADLSNSLYTGELLSHRVKDKVNLYVYAQDIAQANGERLESDVLMLGFRAKSITDLEGNEIDGNAEGNFIPNVIDTYAAGQNLSEIDGAFRTITGGKSAGCLYTYDLSSLPDGLIQIEVYAVDSTGNDGLTGYDPSIDEADGMGNGPRSIFVVKDNKAPAIENEVDKIKSSSIAAPYGWYNKLTIDTVEIYDTTANPILDFGHQKLGAAHENLKWVCNIGTSTDWQVPANDARWVPVSERYKIGSASIDNDGAVSVTIRLMDDLGNISEAKHITSVLCDNTVPDAGNMFCVDASGNQCLNSTKETVVPDSMLIRLPFTEELSGVKVVGLNIKASDGTKVENAFENASILYSAEGAPSAAEPVAIEPDTSSLKALLDSEGYAKTPIFTDGLDSLHVLGASYHTGIFYIKNLTLGDADGMYTVTITLYDAALNKAAEKSVMLAHDTKSPVVDRVVIQNVVPRKVYNENETTYWLPRSAYDDKKDAKYVSVSVTAIENGSGVKVVTIGENAHITEDTTFFIEGTPVAEGRCSIDPKTNTVVFSDYNNPDIYKQTGSVSFVLTNIRLDNPNSADGNKVSVSLKDFVDNSGINENAGNFDLYIDDTSDTKIYKVFSDSMAPGIDAKTPPALADGKADSASDETKYSAARLALEYTDTKNVDLSLTLSAQATGSGVRSLALTNGLFTADTNISVDGKPLAITEYTLDGPIVTFVNSVFTAENTLKFTNVELQGAEDGSQSISITATNFTGWVSKASATKAIVLDRAAPVVDDVRWNLKEGVYGVSKAAVVSNMDLCVTFTEVMTGVKVLGIDPKLNDVSATETPFDSTKFAIKYLSQSEAEAQTQASTEEAEEGKEVKPIEKDPLALIGSAKLLKADEDYTITGNYITFKNPQNFKSGLFVLENLKVADNFEDNKSYKINVHLSDAALNGTAKDGQADLASDSTAPQIKRIFINRLIARTQAGAQNVDSWWISKEDFEQAGKVPTKIDVELTINESGSGVETVVLGENLRLTKDSVITCGTTTLAKDKDYKVSSDFATITLITKSSPKFRDENKDFIVKISNATLTSEGENKVSVTLKDFALNSDENSKLSEIALPENEVVESVFVDFTAPLLAEGGVKIVDRGGSPELDGTADKDANTVALDGFTNEKLVNITVKTASSEDGSAKRSGVKQLVLSGAKYSSSSKFYYKDTASNSEDFAEIMNVDTGDGVTATFKNSYACENVCEFIITNVELTGAEGENTVSVYPVDLTGWSDSEKAVNDKITLDMTPPNWGNNAVVMGTIGENGNDADYVWPKTSGARILASDGEVYFYKRPQGTESEPIYLTVNASDTNFYGLYFVSDASEKSSGAVAVAAKESNKAILTKITDVKFDASSNHEYTIVLKDRAGNISTETKSVHVVKDGEAEIVNDDDENSSLQNNMEYKESRENYHIFKTSVPKTLTREESDGVDRVNGVSGYAVYYNDGNGGKDGVNPVTIEVNLSNHKEKNFTINSGVAYYAINGSAQAPAATLEGEYTAPTSALQNWNKWIPFTSGTTKLTLYPKNDGKNPLNMRLWFKDNVGNVKSIEIKNSAAQTEPDVWICDNTIPQNANGTTDGFVPENSQLSANGLDFDYMMPDHMWKVGTSAASAELKVMYAAALKSEKEEGKAENRLFFTDKTKCTLVINNEPAETVATESGNADSENWAVKLFLYPSNSATAPSREVVKTWIKEEANKNKYFYGIPSGDTLTVSDIEYPKECSESTPYIYVVAEDLVGNINISKLNVKITAGVYNSTAAAKDYWYGKFIYDKESPEVYLGGTGGAQGSRVNFENYSSAEDIAKLVPYNDGRRPYVDSVNGTTWVSSNKYTLTSNPLTGNNTKHIYDKTDSSVKYRMFFYIDVESFAPYAYYYSHDEEAVDNFSIAGNISNVCSPNEKWTILDGTEKEHEEKIPVIIGDLDAMVREASAKELYLHVADKLGRVKTVKMADTKWRHDNTVPTVDFGGETSGLHANDDKGLYRIDAKSKTSLAITFSQEALKKINSIGDDNTVKVYIPHSYITENGSGLYGFSWDANLKDDSPVSVGNPTDGYYLEFTNNTKDSNGSLSISSTTKKFYVLDKVGNSTPIFITSSIDDKPPELTMKFEAHSAALTEKYPDLTLTLIGYDFTEGKIYDASAKSLLDCADSSATPLATSPFRGNNETEGNSEKVGYTKENPYIIYSNAINSEKKFGYIQGTFVAKDQNGTDTTAYSGILTQIIVKRYVITANDSVQTIGTEAKEYPFPIPNKASDSSYTVPMPIYLDGDGDKPTDSVSTGYKGKLYEITVKDSGGNATTVYLKVMRDREAPKFKYDASNYVDSTHHAVVKGGVGYYSGKVFYQYNGSNHAYVELPIADDYKNGEKAKGAAYDEDCGVVATDELWREWASGSDKDSVTKKDNNAIYRINGNSDTLQYSHYLKAVDILGNESEPIYLYVGNTKITDAIYRIDDTKPEISSVTMNNDKYGNFKAISTSNGKILFNYDPDNPSLFNGFIHDFEVTFSTSDSPAGSAAKYCFISENILSAVPENLSEYNPVQAKASGNKFTIKPRTYNTSKETTKSIYFYAIDYAGNLSTAYTLDIGPNNERPKVLGVKETDNIVPYDGVYYFNKNSKITVSVKDENYKVQWHGVYDTIDHANADINANSIAKTLKELSSPVDASGENGADFSVDFTKFGEGPYDNPTDGFKESTLFFVAWNEIQSSSYVYWLLDGKESKSKWTYDASVNAPSSVTLPELASGESKITWLDSDNNTVYYSKAVDNTEAKTFNVNIAFPADVAGIKGYKITVLATSASAPTSTEIAGLTVNEFTGTNKIAPSDGTGVVTRTISVTANDSSDNADKKVYVYAVDGLGNVSSAYTFTISKISNAPNVTGIKTGDNAVKVAGDDGATLKVVDNKTIYVNGKATSITFKPVIANDITGTDGFALSNTDTATKGSDGSDVTYTITFSSTDLPSSSDGTHTYKIYAKNGIGLYSATGYELTIIRDITGPVVNNITLTPKNGKSAKLHEESSKKNLYYNSGETSISNISEDDPTILNTGISSTYTAGSGLPDNEVFAITTSNTEVPTSWSAAGSLLLGERNSLASAIYIAAKDYLGNISYTLLSSVKVTVDSNSNVTINQFIFDATPPNPPTSVAISPNDSFKDGWYSVDSTSTGKNIDLYYNNNKVSNITVTPSLAAADSSLLGYRVGTDGTVNEELTIQLSPGDAKIYAVDKAGNVSESAYVIQMIQDNTVAAPTLPDNAAENPVINDASKDVAFWDLTNSIVYFKNDTSLTEIKLNVNFTAEDATASGLRGYQINSSTITTTSIQPISATNPTLVTIPIPSSLTDGSFSATIHTVDYVGNINSDSEALTVKFKKLTNAANVTGISDSEGKISVTGEGGTFKRGTDSADGEAVIYVNGSVATVTVTPTFTTSDVTGIKGFALSDTGDGYANSENGEYTISLSELSSTADGSKIYTIYAKNGIGLYSASGYPLTIIRDTTGPVVSAITLVAASDGTANLVEETESEVSVNNLYFNKAGLKISAVTAADSKISGDAELPGAGLGPDLEVKYSLVANGELTAEVRTFINEHQYVPDHVSLTFELPLGQDPSSVTKNASEIYIAAIDKVGNIKLTPLSDVDITVGDATEAKKISKFVFDKDAPAVPSSIALTTEAEALVGNGIYYEVTDADNHEASLYYSTKILGSTVTSIVVTPSPAPAADNDLAGYYVKQDGSEFANLTSPNTVTIKLSTKAARIYAIDKAGNTSEINTQRYKITLKNDETAASEISSVRGASGSEYTGTIKAVYGTANHADYVTAYYSSGFKMKFNVNASNSPVVAYGFTYGNFEDTNILNDTNTTGEGIHQVTGSTYPAMNASSNVVKGGVQEFISKTTGWNVISETEGASLSNNVLEINFPVIDEPYVHVRLWVKDAVGNMTMSSGDIICPAKSDPMNMDKVTWWLAADGALPSQSITYSSENKKLTLKGLSTVYPVKSLEITGFTPSDSAIKVSKVKSYIADDKSYEVPCTGSYDSDNNKYTITFKDDKAYIVKNLEINFDKDGLYFKDGAKVKVNSFDSSKEYDIEASPKPKYSFDTAGTTLTITDLWSAYSMKYFSFKHKTEANSGISFGEGESNNMKSVKLYKNGEESTIISSSTAPMTNDNKYIITIDSNGKCADSIVIEFESVPTIAPNTQIEYAQGSTGGILVDLEKAPEALTNVGGTIFTRFIDNVSSGISSIFSGRSMTHEELEALKEAKAEKARARAAEKAAKKAAKKAARDAKKNAEIASASPNQGESWTGLSGEFESASSELDSALAKMKDSSGPEAKASDEVSSKKGIIKVKSGKKNAVSNSKELITDSTVRKTENHDNRMIYVFGFLAMLGVISGIFAKKVRKNSKKS